MVLFVRLLTLYKRHRYLPGQAPARADSKKEGMVARIEDHREQDTAPTTQSDRDPFSVPAEVKAGIRVLVVEDERGLREGLTGALRLQGYDVIAAASGAEAVEVLGRSHCDIVLTDLYLTPITGFDVLRAALASKRDVIVIVITGNPSITTSIEVMRAGAWDYLPKPFSATHLQILLGRAAHVVTQARAMRALRAQLMGSANLLGSDPAFRDAVALATRVAATDASVFLVGESGSGKEIFANYIHQHSRRANRPLVAVNCAALPEALLESEMFGHRRSAFTGADRDKTGLLEVAHDSTMLLEEVTAMPLAVQAKLLRVLQDGVLRRVGSDRTDTTVDVRFISATNRDPQNAVEAGMLRPDLLYRLRVVRIRIPPLRERLQDIPLLASHFLTHFWQRHRGPDALPPKLTRDALDFLRTRAWPGNVRELQNVIEHAVVLAEPQQALTSAELPVIEEQDPAASITRAVTRETLAEPFRPAKEKLVAEFERVYLTRLVNRAGGNMARAARLADIDRTTLYRLVEKHGLAGRGDPVQSDA
jgi:DNA-binding NtrC family response regulator